MRYMDEVFQEPKHYKEGLEISPLDFIVSNKLNFCEGNIVKYICRYKNKGGKDDLQKCKDYINILLKEYE